MLKQSLPKSLPKSFNDPKSLKINSQFGHIRPPIRLREDVMIRFEIENDSSKRDGGMGTLKLSKLNSSREIQKEKKLILK